MYYVEWKKRGLPNADILVGCVCASYFSSFFLIFHIFDIMFKLTNQIIRLRDKGHKIAEGEKNRRNKDKKLFQDEGQIG